MIIKIIKIIKIIIKRKRVKNLNSKNVYVPNVKKLTKKSLTTLSTMMFMSTTTTIKIKLFYCLLLLLERLFCCCCYGGRLCYMQHCLPQLPLELQLFQLVDGIVFKLKIFSQFLKLIFYFFLSIRSDISHNRPPLTLPSLIMHAMPTAVAIFSTLFICKQIEKKNIIIFS